MTHTVIAAMRKETFERDVEQLRAATGPFHRFPFRFDGKDDWEEFNVFLDALVANRNVTHVALYVNDYDGSQCVFVEAMKRPGCAVTTVDVSGSRWLSLGWWLENCGSVKHLIARDIDDPPNMHARSHRLDTCTLETLDLSGNWGVDEKGIECLCALIRECPRLRLLDVSQSQLPKNARTELRDAANERGEGFELVCEAPGEGLRRCE